MNFNDYLKANKIFKDEDFVMQLIQEYDDSLKTTNIILDLHKNIKKERPIPDHCMQWLEQNYKDVFKKYDEYLKKQQKSQQIDPQNSNQKQSQHSKDNYVKPKPNRHHSNDKNEQPNDNYESTNLYISNLKDTIQKTQKRIDELKKQIQQQIKKKVVDKYFFQELERQQNLLNQLNQELESVRKNQPIDEEKYGKKDQKINEYDALIQEKKKELQKTKNPLKRRGIQIELKRLQTKRGKIRSKQRKIVNKELAAKYSKMRKKNRKQVRENIRKNVGDAKLEVAYNKQEENYNKMEKNLNNKNFITRNIKSVFYSLNEKRLNGQINRLKKKQERGYVKGFTRLSKKISGKIRNLIRSKQIQKLEQLRVSVINDYNNSNTYETKMNTEDLNMGRSR